ncbi:MAG: alternative ribosome rescue aminoacyl-tRNA hydrolase ArfB [Actinomycetota bacterium]
MPPGTSDVFVNRRLTIPGPELEVRFSTSSGPGGQHANKASTRVELLWNVVDSQSLSERQRKQLFSKLRNRLDKSGTLRLAGDAHRSQLRNREEVTARLVRIVDDALKVEKHRVATKPTRSSQRRRVESKRKRGETKRLRRSTGDD